MNCIECGEHSGFEDTGAEIHFKGGTKILLIETYQTENVLGKFNGTVDILFLQHWHIEGRGALAFYHHRKNNSLPIPKLIAWNGFNAHFPDGGNLLNGRFDVHELKKLKEEAGEVIPCLEKVGQIPKAWASNQDPYLDWKPDAFFQLDDINNQGNAKVGNVVGKFGDCQHFCSPGPADELSNYWLQLVLYLMSAPGYITQF